jgi:hypothetical protein
MIMPSTLKLETILTGAEFSNDENEISHGLLIVKIV